MAFRPRAQGGFAVLIVSIAMLTAVPAFIAAHQMSAPRPAATVAENATTGGMSVHFKNAETPAWMIELMARQARQAPPPPPGTPGSVWI